MYRTALRSSAGAFRAARPTTLSSTSRRLVSTAATAKKGTWKGTGLRWGLAIAAVYYYNTSPIFADELPPQSFQAPSPFSDADEPTINALIEEKRKQPLAFPPPPPAPKEAPVETTEPTADVAPTSEHAVPEAAVPEPGSPEALEQEAEQQGAFNPETGEINWDCPCLGGMAHGPCGEEFKSAFSCFVYSTEEPKGMDCIEKFQGMQDCFRKYPEIYGSEIDGDEETNQGEGDALDAGALAKNDSDLPSSEQLEATNEPVKAEAQAAPAVEAEKEPKEEAVVPNQAHDATKANDGKEQ